MVEGQGANAANKTEVEFKGDVATTEAAQYAINAMDQQRRAVSTVRRAGPVASKSDPDSPASLKVKKAAKAKAAEEAKAKALLDGVVKEVCAQTELKKVNAKILEIKAAKIKVEASTTMLCGTKTRTIDALVECNVALEPQKEALEEAFLKGSEQKHVQCIVKKIGMHVKQANIEIGQAKARCKAE